MESYLSPEQCFPNISELFSDVKRTRLSKVKLGVVFSERKVFTPDYGYVQYEKLLNVLNADPNIEVVNLVDAGMPEGVPMAGDFDGVEAAIRLLQYKGTDALLVGGINYADEWSVGTIAAHVSRALRIPIFHYTWADASIKSDGERETDVECGALPMGVYTGIRSGVKMDYFPLCNPESPEFSKALKEAIAVSSGIASMRNVRMLQVGAPEPTFMAIRGDFFTMEDLFDLKLVEEETATLIEFIRHGLIKHPDAFGDVMKDLSDNYDYSAVEGEFPDLQAKLALTLIWLAEMLKKKQCNSVTIRCWPELPAILEMLVCSVNGILNDLGIPAPCETDLLGGIGLAFIDGLGIYDPVRLMFFADYLRLYPTVQEDKSVVGEWHCGPFGRCGLRGACAGCKGKIIKGWILPEKSAGPLDGDYGNLGDSITVVQFRPNEKRLITLTGYNGKIVEGPYTKGTHSWIEVDSGIYDFINSNPVDHHGSCVIGNRLPLVKKAAKWIGLSTQPAFLDSLP
ncbi:MAG: hypothetical protein PHE77_02085 [Candidatus Pacebacteria bacterium]|nr:hypothetical protein [Candidatus Paceibacterota bacterium]